jgi:hemolysin III
MKRQMSRGEFLVDAVLHGFGVAFGVAVCITLAAIAAVRGEPELLARFLPYAMGLVAMFGCSALYNLTRSGKWKTLFRRFDHAAIFLMIAGSYTPFSLIMVDRAWGYGLLAFVWTVALGGAGLKLFLPLRFERLCVLLYLLLGWTIVVAFGPLLASVPAWGVALLLAGGLLYSLGVVFHLWESLAYQNAIWHGFVLVAAACHFAAVLVAV